jgi:hypothetical protein
MDSRRSSFGSAHAAVGRSDFYSRDLQPLRQVGRDERARGSGDTHDLRKIPEKLYCRDLGILDILMSVASRPPTGTIRTHHPMTRTDRKGWPMTRGGGAPAPPFCRSRGPSRPAPAARPVRADAQRGATVRAGPGPPDNNSRSGAGTASPVHALACGGWRLGPSGGKQALISQ